MYQLPIAAISYILQLSTPGVGIAIDVDIAFDFAGVAIAGVATAAIAAISYLS